MSADRGDTEEEGRKGEALRQLASVAISGSSVQTEPGKNPDKISEDE